MMQSHVIQSTTGSLKQFIPQSPATTVKKKEISRWQQRHNKNENQMNLLSNIESYFETEPKTINVLKATNKETNLSSKSEKRFLRKGGGTVNQRNKYEIEQQRKNERKRMKQLGLAETKPKTQKIIFMEQWREKQKKKDKILRKKKDQIKIEPINTDTTKKTKSNINAIKLLKQKKKASANVEEKTPSDELESASKFEDLGQFDDAVLIKHHIEITEGKENIENVEKTQKQNTEKIGIWTKPKLPKKLNIKPQKGYNFARHNVLSNDRSKKSLYPTYSHHHHTSLYGSKKNNNSQHKLYSEHKNLFHKQATVNCVSKRDRLAAKYNERKAAEPQISAEKAYLAKIEDLQETIAKYEEKGHSAEIMKQSSLEQFRKYQSLIHDKVGNLEEKQKEFEKYKKKQERILIQKTQDIDKRSRALLNIPDRKQRKQIEELKKEINDLKMEFIEKEKRYKSKIERLKKQNKKVMKERVELQNEIKKAEKERLEIWERNKDKDKHKMIQQKQPSKKQKKFCIQKIRPKSHHGLMMRTGMSNQHQPYEYDEQYDSTSSESSSASDESTKNGEDEAQKAKESVLITNQNVINIKNSKEKEDNMSHQLPNVPPEYDPNKMSTQQINCESVKNSNNPLERMQHPDGKIEQIYCDGSKLILFPNETEKYIFSNLNADGEHKQVYVKFPNGDVKKILSDGTEVYYYSNNEIIHASKLDGIQLFYFNSQHEVHFPDNTKHILFVDGTKKYIYPNGDEQCVFPQNDSV